MQDAMAAGVFEAGADLGVSEWLTVTQDMISAFGRETFDPDPMHVDPEWSKEHSPYKVTIAFGFQTLSYLSHWAHQILSRQETASGVHFLNYGFDRLRFLAPVRVGSRVRARMIVASDERRADGRRLLSLDVSVDIEEQETPALAGRWLFMVVPQ